MSSIFGQSNAFGTGAGTTGFTFGAPKTTATTGILGTAATTSAPGIFGQNPASSTATGFSLGAPATSASTGFGFSFGKTNTAATSAPSFGGLLGTAPTSSSTLGGLGGGNLFGQSSAAVSSATGAGIFTSLPQTSTTSIFSSVPQTTATVGLGGLDPSAAQKQGLTSSTGNASDGKTAKETLLPEALAATVDALQKHVKEEKAVREDITRMSCKPLVKVQENITALRQLLSVVANGLQRNACSVEKLKQEMTQKLKNAEMAQRTKDIPASMQYENIEYFQRLVEEFEERMASYRQQIDTLENHLAALHQPSAHSPSEMVLLLKKLHETFISLAAQLQQVHESVKIQKEQFLTYRRVFHGETKNVFQRSTPAPRPVRKVPIQASELAGPNPFQGVTNAANQAMAMAHGRAQQPQGPPVTGLVGGSQISSGFGSGLFGMSKPATGFGSGSSNLSGTGTSIGSVGSLFSSSLASSPLTGGFSSPATLGTSTTAALNLAGTSLNTPLAAKQPFQLQKPPQGAKRGKR